MIAKQIIVLIIAIVKRLRPIVNRETALYFTQQVDAAEKIWTSVLQGTLSLVKETSFNFKFSQFFLKTLALG